MINQKEEALKRISTLEETMDINPNIRRYFTDDRLYYSYITAGGFMASIDTIQYEEKYETICKNFEKETSALVYHAIEFEDTLALLFVSNNPSNWENEQPKGYKVFSRVYDLESGNFAEGYITVDCMGGAILRTGDAIENTIDNTEDSKVAEFVKDEILKRLKILQETAMQTDLDIASIYENEGELCCSSIMQMLGITLVDRLNRNTKYKKVYDMIADKFPGDLYFAMGSADNKIAFLTLSPETEDWEVEEDLLSNGISNALVVDLDEGVASVKGISFSEVVGGPLFEEIL